MIRHVWPVVFGVVAVGSPALAADGAAFQDMGPYLSAHGGLLWLLDATAHIPSDGDSSVSSYDLGHRFGGAFGVDVSSHFGIEGEFSYAHAGLNHVALSDDITGPIWSNPATGGASVGTFMGNLIARAQWQSLQPYVGVGAGLAIAHSETSTVNQYDEPLAFADTDQTWAVQGFLGADFALSPDATIGARYRVQYVGPFSLYDGFINIDGSVWRSVEVTLKVKLGNR